MFCHLFANLSLIAAATSNVVVVVDAAPTGASACPGDIAATTGPLHAVPEGGVPTFAAKGYEIVLDEGKDTEMVVGDSDMAQVLAEVMYTVSVRATDSMFRGALIRLEGDGTLEPGANSQVADVCGTFAGVAGVTHTNATEKDILSGTMMIMGDSVLDVTVVESNNNVDGSVYSYRQVQLQVMAPPSSTPIALVEPTVSTPAPPTAEPTTVPKPGPPISAPTAGPTVTAATTPTSTSSSKAPTMGKEPAAGKGPTVVMAPTTPGGTPPTAPVATAPTTTTATAPVAAPTASSAPIILTTTGFMAGVVGSVIWSML